MDYRRTLDYARRLRPAIQELRDMLPRDPVECCALSEYALKRLFKVVERIDDSAGAVGDCMAEIADLHAQACQAVPPGKALAKRLWALQAQDQWSLLPIARYWDALGPQGQAAYAAWVVAAFDGLPPVRPGHWDHAGFHACAQAEALARCSGDFELLQRVLRRDLSSPRAYLRVLESLRAHGRAREALAFAEEAVKRFPGVADLRDALAQCLDDAGLDEDALAQRWLAFAHQPEEATWDALKRSAGTAWPQWRERALAHVQEPAAEPAGMRIVLLAHDGALADAIDLARSKPVETHTLHMLARQARRVDPVAAAEFCLRLAIPCAQRLHGPGQYKELVALLAQSARCARLDALQAFVAEVRAAHARKTRLMAMLDQAGL
jgi:tetratricopeptide (TPR) repeat protein